MMNMAITSAEGQNKKKKKKTQGRRKIEIKEIEKKSSLHVTFSKRRNGLMKKASEISILCGAEAALIALSPGEKKVFAFGHPDVESVLARHTNYQSLSAYNNNNHTLKSSKQLAAAPTVGSSQELGIQQQELKLKREYEESLQKLQEEKMKAATIANEEELIKQKGNIGNGFWWEDPVDDMGLQELEDFKKALLQLRRNAASKFNHCYGDASYPLNSLVSGGTDIIGCPHLMHGPPQIN